MDTFSEALLSGKTDKIPESLDWFAPLLGDWDCDYFDEYVKGEKPRVSNGHGWVSEPGLPRSESSP